MKSREFGTIATFNGTYAFIRPDSGERDIFAHETELPGGHVHRGDRVSYDVTVDPYKPGRILARRVRFIEAPSVQEDAEEEREQVNSEYQREEKHTLAEALRRAGHTPPEEEGLTNDR
jgi:cold shock CspA family protein